MTGLPPEDVKIRRSSPSELLRILKSGEFEPILGIREDMRIEFKRELNLDHNQEKQKLAKSVSALANSDGGLLVIGVASEADPSTRADYASELVFVPSVDEGRYYRVLSELLYPAANITVELYGTEPHRLVGVTVQPAGPEAPILLKRVVSDGLSGGSIFGYFRRTEIEANPATHAEVHALIKAGQTEPQLASLQTALEELARELVLVNKKLQKITGGKQ